MSHRSIQSGTGIPSTAYTRDYYTNCCNGFEEFIASRGDTLPLRLRIPLDLAGIQSGQHVLDVGCGRGELLVHSARRGATAWGLDYAEAALHLANEALDDPRHSAIRSNVRLLLGSVLELPLHVNQMDIVFMLDVVEHLYPAELARALDESFRVLKPQGKLIVHTMPNLWYYRWGYPTYRAVQRLRGRNLPTNPRDRWGYREVHVNEQTPPRLRAALQRSGFRSKVWLKTAQSYSYEKNAVVRAGMKLLTEIYPFRWIFCNDIFAIGVKP